jgi:SAM-dependent methyltransferase
MCQDLYCPKCHNRLGRTDEGYRCQPCATFYPVTDGIPSFVSQDTTVDSFDASAFEFLFKMEQKHFWHISRKEMALDTLKRNPPNFKDAKMLEIGCGNGNILSYLKRHGVHVEGGDIFIEGLRFCRQQAALVPLYQVDVLSLPFRDEYDIIGAFDILEHIEDDDKALAEIYLALKARGKLIMTVPAYKFMWSYTDESARHKRRYSKNDLAVKLEQSGFIIKKISYYMCFLFPLLFSIRLISNILWRERLRSDRRVRIELKTIPIVNSIFLGLLRLEKWLMRYINLPFGTSLLVLAEKK